MQYYRLWVYVTNSALGITSLVFFIFASFVLCDLRFTFLKEIEFYEPTFIYAYIALFFQCFIIPAFGCYGAKRLSEYLLSIYWGSLFALTMADFLVGIFWVFKIHDMKSTFNSSLGKDFYSLYGKDEFFTHKWNKLQGFEGCCGHNGPLDYEKLNPNINDSQYVTLPESCCAALFLPPDVNLEKISPRKIKTEDDSLFSFTHKKRHFTNRRRNPNFNTYNINNSSTVVPSTGSPYDSIPFTCHSKRLNKSPIKPNNNKNGIKGKEIPESSTEIETNPKGGNLKLKKFSVYKRGCGIMLAEWLDNVSGNMFVLGFCFVGFVKLVFLGILRIEIREMGCRVRMIEKDRANKSPVHISSKVFKTANRTADMTLFIASAIEELPEPSSSDGNENNEESCELLAVTYGNDDQPILNYSQSLPLKSNGNNNLNDPMHFDGTAV